MGRVHDALVDSKCTGHSLEVLLVRLMFCLFADDIAIFRPAGSFRRFVEERTSIDGSDLGPQFSNFFQALDTPENVRATSIDEEFSAFPYVDCQLFEEQLPIINFDSSVRSSILDCCDLNWSSISPAIFGEIFQSVMDVKSRRSQGAHYTSEENILKLIRPLFLDSLRADLDRARNSENLLSAFRKKLRGLTFLDPACGCGNFLVVAFRELRLLDIEVLRAIEKLTGQPVWSIQSDVGVDGDQFFGIEIDEFAAQIARVALYLVDRQTNMQIIEEFGVCEVPAPRNASPTIVHGNALSLDWNTVLPASRAAFVFGNPPFVGAKFLNDQQRQETRRVFSSIDSCGLLDYVAAWFVNAADYISGCSTADLTEFLNSKPGDRQMPYEIRCAFVSTNSITQGEQVGVLWEWLLARGIRIHFAHCSFPWKSEARSVAAVHCVIVGFGLFDCEEKKIFRCQGVEGVPPAVRASNINPYLVDAPNVLLRRRNTPICDVPPIGIGNKPIDGGNYLFTESEMHDFLRVEPRACEFFREWMGADEFVNGKRRFCLWLGDATLHQIHSMPTCSERVDAVKKFRLGSKSAPTRRLANTPTRFHVEFVPNSAFLFIPRVSTERREWIPIGFAEPSIMAGDALLTMPHATLYHFAVLSSKMHISWVRAVCGRLGNAFRYSASIVYNNFPWPNPTKAQASAIDNAAKHILAARVAHPQSTIADLYDPLTMPPDLRGAHERNDRCVCTAYGYQGDNSDSCRVGFLFTEYGRVTGR
ncbi:MAG: hypothetical protein FWD57_15745 [Polyangiaceae bacterium]|nr:hypothetical protein [Polyangiaceae bacterium]